MTIEVTLKVVAEPLKDILQQFDVIEVHRSTTGISGTYSEITVAGTRVVLEYDKTEYEYVDSAGDTTYFYKYRFRNIETDRVGPFSNPVRGLGLDSDWILTVDELQALYLFGMNLTDDDGNPYPPRLFQHYINSAIARVEKELAIDILPTTRVENHDYYSRDYEEWGWLQTDHLPVRAVSEVAVQYPGQTDWTAYPSEWYRLDKEGHVIRLVPQSGNLSSVMLGASGGFLSLVHGAYSNFPHLYRVTYTSGFDAGSLPGDIKDLVGMYASIGPLNIAGDLLIGAGISNLSISVPGLSQSIGTTSSATNAGYGARILNYMKQIKTMVPYLRQYYLGLQLRGM